MVEAGKPGGVITAGTSSNELKDTQEEGKDEAEDVSAGMVLGYSAVVNLVAAATAGGGRICARRRKFGSFSLACTRCRFICLATAVEFAWTQREILVVPVR